MIEFIQLLGLGLWVRGFLFVEYIRVIFCYYRKFSFAKEDIALLGHYLFRNPFRICKNYLLSKGKSDVYTYGETPIPALDLIARECGLTSKDIFFEIGCGRGRGCFWMRAFVGCRVVGIEWVPEFVKIAQKVQRRYEVDGVEFRQEDMFHSSMMGATAIYLYGTSLKETEIRRLITSFAALPKGVKIITVSYPLADYADNPIFEVQKSFTARFPWGVADIYLQTRM